MPSPPSVENPSRATARAAAPAFHLSSSTRAETVPDLVCFAHLHWDFVWQRPQHLLSRFAQHGRVFYVEEPFIHAGQAEPHLEVKERQYGLKVIVAHLPYGLEEANSNQIQYELLARYFAEQEIERYMFWYYTPMALDKSRQFKPVLTVYDCMDELAAFKFAPPALREREQELFEKADLVFTGGQTLYEAKSLQHSDAHAFPSSIDKEHFWQARATSPTVAEPTDQAHIAHPRVGFFGVVDERLDIQLLGELAEAHPEWQFVIIGPVVKIDPATLPRHTNIHYLGGKNYQELPSYLRGWDVATLLFADNESTKFISPTKTPEYLAAGRPVVSTPIRDVVRPYGDLGLVHIAATAQEFSTAIAAALHQHQDSDWLRRTDEYLNTISWNCTWESMVALIQARILAKEQPKVDLQPATSVGLVA